MSDRIRLLIGSGQNKFYYIKKFSETLQKYNVDCKVVIDVDICNGFPSKDVSQWFRPYEKFDKLRSEEHTSELQSH